MKELKGLLSIFLLGLISLLVIAQNGEVISEPELEEVPSYQIPSTDDYYADAPITVGLWEDPTYINTLSGNDLAQAIIDGTLADIHLINDDKMAETIRSDLANPDPEAGPILQYLPTTDFSRALRSDLTLLQSREVLASFEERLREQSFRDEMNHENSQKVKATWFAHYQITDLGASIADYDGERVTITGTKTETTFDPREHPQATVLDTGNLVDERGAVISGAVSKQEGTTLVESGYIDLSEARGSGSYGAREEGSIIFGYDAAWLAHGGSTGLNVLLSGGKVDLKGENVYVDFYNPTQDYFSPAMVFSGEITFYPDTLRSGHLTFGKNTEVTTFDIDRGTKEALIKVTEETDYYQYTGFCYFTEKSCIALNRQSLRVEAKSDNQISISLLNKLEKIEVALILDRSMVNLNDGQIVVSRSFPITRDPSKLGEISEEIVTYFSQEPEHICRQAYGLGVSQSCMSVLEYNSIQTLQSFEEEHKALIDVRGYGRFYGSEWFRKKIVIQRQLKEKVTEMEEKVKRTRADIESMYEELRQKPNYFQLIEKIVESESILHEMEETLIDARFLLKKDAPTVISCIGLDYQIARDAWPQGEARTTFTKAIREKKAIAPIALQALIEDTGWDAVFYAPDTINPAERKEEDQKYHQQLYERTRRSGIYTTHSEFGPVTIPIDEFVVNYRLSQTSQEAGIIPSPDNLERVEMLSYAPFGFGFSRDGVHAYAISYGRVFEVHYTSTSD